MNQLQIIIPTTNQDLQDIIIAQLSVNSYDGFEQTETLIKAYINQDVFNEENLVQILQENNLEFTKEKMPVRNWNEVWESNFEPVIIDDFVSIRAAFHQPITTTKHEIIITPKMSFGTGHHATTHTVMQLMQHINFNDKTVFDFGTGTGILAILAEKLGATNIVAVDYDDWCIKNATENIAKNNCIYIEIEKANTAEQENKFDIVIANINKNIIRNNFTDLHNCCKPTTTILLSGLLIEDENDILKLVQTKKWKHIKTLTKGAWIAMEFIVSS